MIPKDIAKRMYKSGDGYVRGYLLLHYTKTELEKDVPVEDIFVPIPKEVLLKKGILLKKDFLDNAYKVEGKEIYMIRRTYLDELCK